MRHFQERFVRNGTTNDTSIWYIPLNFATQSKPLFDNTSAQFWFTKESDKVTIESLGSNDWYLINLQQKGEPTRKRTGGDPLIECVLQVIIELTTSLPIGTT